MKNYLVTWELELSATDAVDAARQARRVQLDPNSRATVFTVVGDSGHHEIDLDDVDD